MSFNVFIYLIKEIISVIISINVQTEDNNEFLWIFLLINNTYTTLSVFSE